MNQAWVCLGCKAYSSLSTLSVSKRVGRVLKASSGGNFELALKIIHLEGLPGMLLGIASG